MRGIPKTLLKDLNAGSNEDAAQQYRQGTVRGKEVEGLKTQKETELALWSHAAV